MKDNREWAHREAKRRAQALGKAISIYCNKHGIWSEYIVRATYDAVLPHSGFVRVATIEPDGSYSFGSGEA